MVSNLSNTNLNVMQTPLQQKSGVKYAITSPITTAQQIEIHEDKKKKTKQLGMKIGGTVLAVGLAALGLSKGLPKSARTKINEFMHTLEEKTSKLSNKTNKTTFENLYYKGLNKVKTATNLAQGACNFTPLKDSYFKNLLTDKVPFLKKFCNKCDTFFEGLSVNITKKTYKKAASQFDDMTKAMKEATKKMNSENATQAKEQISKLRKSSRQLMSESSIDKRLDIVKDGLEGLDDKVWEKTKNLKGFFSDRNTYTSFLSEELAAPTKIKSANIVDTIKEAISVSSKDKTNSIKKLINTMDSFVTDKQSYESLKEIRKAVNEYSKTGDEKLLNNLLKKMKQFNKQVPDKTVKQEITKGLQSLSSGKTGQVQELMAMYKKSLSVEDYTQLEKKVNKAMNTLNIATDKETNKLFDKLRDIKIGSIFTDLGGLVIPIATGGILLGKADNKDEKASVALKYGVPALGAVSVCLLCTVNLISGLPALAIGLGSGWVMNKIGAIVDNARKSNNQKKQIAQNGFFPTLQDKIKLS